MRTHFVFGENMSDSCFPLTIRYLQRRLASSSYSFEMCSDLEAFRHATCSVDRKSSLRIDLMATEGMVTRGTDCFSHSRWAGIERSARTFGAMNCR